MIFTKSYVRVILLIIATVIILLLPTLLRDSSGYITEEPYFLERISNLLRDKNTEIDNLSYIERPFTYLLAQPFILSLFNNLNEKAILILPILFGIISLILFYFILKKLNISQNIRDLSAIILIISPPFIYTFSHNNS
ncbi:MAG: hypothetical protein AABX55_00440, partial [Nanoarchaeota archaeon]